jgi:hypothetical protein
VLDDLTVLVEGDARYAAFRKRHTVIRSRYVSFDGYSDLGIEHGALFGAEFAQFQLAGQRGLAAWRPPVGSRPRVLLAPSARAAAWPSDFGAHPRRPHCP